MLENPNWFHSHSEKETNEQWEWDSLPTSSHGLEISFVSELAGPQWYRDGGYDATEKRRPSVIKYVEEDGRERYFAGWVYFLTNDIPTTYHPAPDQGDGFGSFEQAAQEARKNWDAFCATTNYKEFVGEDEPPRHDVVSNEDKE